MTRMKTNYEVKDAEFQDDTYPVEIEEGVNIRKFDKNEKNDEVKEVECPDDTSPLDIEEGVSDRKYDKN